MNEELTERLRAAAEAHQPDRARILARVERGMSGAPGRRPGRTGARPWPRVAFASLTAVGALAVGGFAVAAIVQSPPARPEVSATPAAPSTPSGNPRPTPSTPSTPSAPATGRPATPDRSSPTSPSPSASSPAAGAAPAGTRVQDGPLSSSGALSAKSNNFWAQNDITLKSAQPLTALTVELRITQTGAVQNTGNWRTLPAEDFTVTVQNEGAAVVYRWVLKPGRTVPAGQHVFAGQYNHATGVRGADHDGYRVDANGPRGPLSVWGGFTPAR
ncbi:hypothetical protein [Streptomyces sp. NPDC029003]|uniref:hypothetical protein n=1 Tax=Streptomyces sp. NPDC029003 TaxID=3155125 RepID=UPI0033F322FA